MKPKLTALRWVPPIAQGYAHDHRVRWALEEAAIAYEVVLVDRSSMDTEEYRSWQPFGQIPAYRDREVEIFESGAIVLHIAKSSAILAPADARGYARVATWIFAALNTIEPAVAAYAHLDAFYAGQSWVEAYRPIAEDRLKRRLADLQRWLTYREYLEDRFTAADIVMSTVLRDLDDAAILSEFPTLASYRARCEARPAFARAIDAQLKDYSENMPTQSEA
ncbi:glutathione S-transferase family protein [Methylosinus sp. PW1]|uniref:glutathione S-transferase family protein n=1 Tax=Methylosinus sp. PW1 TaxID=107636 RepID=UPI00056C611B|nr:glutathione S-transferase family protein [Methylosinus sp. PW1]